MTTTDQRRQHPDFSISNRLMAEPFKVRKRVLELLDEISQPMHPRAIERALLRSGYTRTEARKIVLVLKHLPIIAIGAGLP